MRVHFTRHGAILADSFSSPATSVSESECLIPLKGRFFLNEDLVQACRNPRDLSLLRDVEKCAGDIDNLTEKAAGLGDDSVDGKEPLEDTLNALQQKLDLLQEQKQMLLFFAETNSAMADELASVSVCYTLFLLLFFHCVC